MSGTIGQTPIGQGVIGTGDAPAGGGGSGGGGTGGIAVSGLTAAGGASIIPGVLAAPLFQFANRAVEQVLITRPRAIGLLVPNVVVEENHRDELSVTEHPIERGAAISDHFYKRPAEVTMRAAWSNSSPFGDGTENYAQFMYDQLLRLQVSGEPFNLVTGKRLYRNMMMIQLQAQTDARFEYALMATAIFREVLIVDTQATTLPPQENQALPEKTAPVIDNGTKSPVADAPAERRSVLRDLFGG
jgi:hypothetical protein